MSLKIKCYQNNQIWLLYKWICQLKHCKNCKTLPREHHIGCQVVIMFLLKDPFKFVFSSSHKWSFVITQVLSQFEKSFVTVWIFELCHNLSLVTFWVLEFCHNLSFVTIQVFEFCNILSYWVLWQSFWVFITVWVFEFHHILGFQVTS